MTSKFKQFLTKFAPIIIMIGALSLIHIGLSLSFGDDEFFKGILRSDGFNMVTFLKIRYLEWSSRIVIESLLIWFVHHARVWAFFNISMFILAYHSIAVLFGEKTKVDKYSWLLVGLFMLYPFEHLSSAGWIATSMNYLWPLAFGLFALIPIVKHFREDKILWYEYILYFIATIYAANQEQVAGVLFGAYGLTIIYSFIKRKRINRFFILQSVWIALNMVFILKSPGNELRSIANLNYWFPEYEYLSFFNKVEIGISSTFHHFILKPNLLYSFFTGIIFVGVWNKTKHITKRTIAFVPFGLSLAFGYFYMNTLSVFPNIHSIVDSLTKFGTSPQLNNVLSLLPLLVILLSISSLFIGLYICSKDMEQFIIMVVVLALGFASRFIIAFTPSIWASSYRTFIFMYFSIIIVTYMVYQNVRYIKQETHLTFYSGLLLLFAILTFLNVLFIKTF